MTERQTIKALAYPLKVVVSPLKAFKEIAQNPSIVGFMLIFGLYLLATASAEYTRAAKIILDGTQPASLLSSNLFGARLIIVLFQGVFSFLLSWILYAGVLLLMTRFLGVKGGSWRSFFIVVGYVFFVLVIFIAINAVLILTLPEIHFEMSVWSSGTSEDIAKVNSQFNEVWGPTLAVQVVNYLGFAFQFWQVALGAIAVHASREILWGRALIVSVAAYFISLFVTASLTAL